MVMTPNFNTTASPCAKYRVNSSIDIVASTPRRYCDIAKMVNEVLKYCKRKMSPGQRLTDGAEGQRPWG